MMIANVARDAAVQQLLGGVERAAEVIRARAGGAFDPQVAGCLADNAAEILARDREASAWEETLASEPHPWLTLEGEAIDRALAAMGAFADLVSPSFVGHSAGVADLAEAAAERCRLGVPNVPSSGAPRSCTTSGGSWSRLASGIGRVRCRRTNGSR